MELSHEQAREQKSQNHTRGTNTLDKNPTLIHAKTLSNLGTEELPQCTA